MSLTLLWMLLLTISIAGIAIYYEFIVQPPKPPEMITGWFGVGNNPKLDDEALHKFTVSVEDEVLQDLKQRLENTRLSEDLEESTFEYGIQTSVLRTVLKYWKDEYNWKKHENIINSFDQYKTQIEGLMVHFLHVKSKHKTASPLLLLHGWPGSVWEFHKIIPMLTDPIKHGGSEQDAFDVIAPSIPGFGFSEEPHHRGSFDVVSAARVYYKLMKRLGYQQYYIQGGDMGSIIGTIMAAAYPREISGLHLNMFTPPASSTKALMLQIFCPLWPTLFVDENEAWKCRPIGQFFLSYLEVSGYLHIQATKPDTIGVGLNDSPIGLAGYVLEKFAPYTDVKEADGSLFKFFSLDELLTNIMIYWVNGNIKSSVRFYKEFFIGDALSKTGWDPIPITVPTGLAAFPGEFLVVPKIFLTDKYENIIQYTDMPRGGHFAALEEPVLLAKDIRDFVSKVKKTSKM